MPYTYTGSNPAVLRLHHSRHLARPRPLRQPFITNQPSNAVENTKHDHLPSRHTLRVGGRSGDDGSRSSKADRPGERTVSVLQEQSTEGDDHSPRYTGLSGLCCWLTGHTTEGSVATAVDAAADCLHVTLKTGHHTDRA